MIVTKIGERPEESLTENPKLEIEAESSKEEAAISPASAYFKLWHFATPLDFFLRCLAALIAAGGGTAEPIMAIIFGSLVDLLNGTSNADPAEFRSEISKYALYFVYLFIGKFACVYTAAILFNFTASHMTSKIRLRYLRKVLHQPISYFDKNAPGIIATSLANDTNVVQVGLSEKLGIVFQALSMMMCSFIIALTKNWKLTLACIPVVPWMIVLTGFFGGLSAKFEAKATTVLNQASGLAEEALSSILNVTAMGAAEKIVHRYSGHIRKAMRNWVPIGPLTACIYGNMFLSTNSAYSIALFYGVKLLNRGEIKNGGTIVMVLLCVVLANSSMGFLAPLIPDITKATAASQQIIKVIGHPMEDETSAGKKIDSLEGEMELKGISFFYPERPTLTVMDNLSLRIPKNKVTAIVGSSGSGKSTIVGLLDKWYTVTQGTILVDGHNINDLDIKWWRTQIGLVQQEPVLFNDTIYRNVLNGLRESDLETLSEEKKRGLVVEACKRANAHNFIQQLPNGYDTLAGERAGLLSGGQKQRIAIARSIVSDPRILLLDEATSALDSESERAVSTALEKVSRGRTTVMIAHKLATVVNADNIVVLKNGVIVEQGTHADLVALEGHYCRLLLAQGGPSDHSSKQEVSAELADHISKTISRKLTRRSTKGSEAILEEIASSLESIEISRRKSLLWCIYTMYAEHPNLIPFSIVGTAASIMAGASFPLQSFFFSRFVTISQVQGAELIRRGNFWALMFFIVGFSALIAYLVLFTIMGIVGARFAKIYYPSYLRAMLGQDIGFFQHPGNTSGGLTTLLAQDCENMAMLYSMNSGLIISMLTTLIACCIMAIAVNWKLGLVSVFGCVPVLLAAGFVRMRLDLTAQDRYAAVFLESARYSTEAISAIRTISSLTMEGKVENMYSQKLHGAWGRNFRGTLVTMMFYALGDSLVLAASGLVFWYGGRLVSFGEMSSAQFFLIFAAIIFGGQSSGFIFGFTSSTNKAHAGINRILYLTHSKPSINSSTGLKPGSSPLPAKIPTIEFCDIHFRYPLHPTVPVLRGISLSVPRGAHVCVVGPSGCGKSTLVALLERFYDLKTQSTTSEKLHDSGEIRIYGRPIKEWDIHKVREMIGLVAQDTTLYQGTIRDNILLGIDESKIEHDELEIRIETACRQANIHNFITSLPQSYTTDIGARGVALSGGQRQRISLARCLIRNPDILLLDEATSALDAESEKAVREALTRTRQEREGLTIMSVTHQVEAMRDADRIFVVDKGVIVEEGNWEELMARKGRLWAMVVQGEVQGQA
ncbi:multidrug resistance protein [Periconia macrospinosa]|uniref:Multidrug resistance protein n=1 Tax=Periconia macrospinosa TaxID=97972 RepID=A0A2V1D2I7_9PLEO|nr:multidrug resistance protein [Periconia macrospinosa]